MNDRFAHLPLEGRSPRMLLTLVGRNVVSMLQKSPGRGPGDQLQQRGFAREIERRRVAANEPVDDLQVLAAAELAAILAEQDRRRRRSPWNARRDDARRVLDAAPTTPMTGVG